VQRPAQSSLRRLGFGGVRLFQRCVRVDKEECVEARVQSLNSIEECLN
jgi:hypothetical protein